jgi:hypothetical protein
MSLPILPNEIWYRIFQFLQRHEIYSCMTVCKNWQAPAIQAYYEEILIKESKIKFVKSNLLHKEEDDPDQQFAYYGQSTKKLTITVDSETYGFFNEGSNCQEDGNKDSSSKLKTEEFLLLLSYLPNLKIINLSFSAYHNYYMAILCDAVPGEYLKRIEEITNLTYHKPYQELHFSACYNFRQTITRLVVFPNDYIINGSFGNFLKYLPHFTQLTHLSIYNDREKDLTIFNILLTCPNLKSLKYTSYFPVPDKAEYIYDRMTQKIDKSKFLVDSLADLKSPSYYSKHLKVLDLNLPALTETYIQYITHYTPTNLDTVMIHIQGADFHNWIHDPLVLKLAQRLSKVKNLQIHASPEISPHTLLETKMNRFYKFIIALKGDRDLYCEATFSKSRSSETIIDIRDNQYMTFTCGIVDNGQSSLLVDVDSIQGPEIINSLKFMIFQRDKTIPQKILKHAHKSCPRLEILNIDCIYPYYNFKVWSCEGRDRKKINRKKKLPTAHTRLTNLSLEELTLSQDLLDTLSTYLPNIEMIKCLGPACSKDESNFLHNGSIFNLAVFQHLKTFYFDIRNIKMNVFDYVFVQFDFTEDITACCCYKIKKMVRDSGKEEHQEYTVAHTTNVFMAGCRREGLLRTSVITFGSGKSIDVKLCVNDVVLAELRHNHTEGTLGDASFTLPPN